MIDTDLHMSWDTRINNGDIYFLLRKVVTNTHPLS